MTSAELMAFVKKNPISVGCGILALGLGAVVYFRAGAIPEAENKLAQKSADAERHGANVRNAEQLKEQFDETTAAGKEIESRMIHASQNFGPNQQYFLVLVRETEVKLIEYRPGGLTAAAKGAKSSFSPIQFTVSVNGTLSQVMDFLFRLENGAHYCRVNSAQLFCAPQSRTAMTLQLSLDLLGLP